MSKPTTVCIVALLLCLTLCSAARRPALLDKVVAEHQVKTEEGQVEASCQGISDEECLMGRDLAAHLDYIYTQSHNKP
ncbi:hypothetical protein CASFOL_015318 [Castilleja foliolosa]|uniref:Phytosulfokine n=1 Tax=Castilleja foliolosa TaxID=1961234 RepID=A0ABD3DDC1_9LAMI